MPDTPSPSITERRRVVIVVMNNTDDPPMGSHGVSVGFQLLQENEKPYKRKVLVEMGAFSDEHLSRLADDVLLSKYQSDDLQIPTLEGEIRAGMGQNSIKALTDENGLFSCMMSKSTRGTVYLGVAPTFGSPTLECRDKDGIQFS